MAKGIIGKKIGMTQVFSDNGAVIPVTVVQAGPCVVVQKKTVESDGYNAIQIGFEEILAITLYKSGSKRYSQKRKLINLWLDISKKQMLSL